MLGPPLKSSTTRCQLYRWWGCWELGPPTGKQTAVVAATGTATAANVAPKLAQLKVGSSKLAQEMSLKTSSAQEIS